MSSEIEISVIIPTFNEEKNIRNTLENLRKQSMYNFEILIVDDGSTDGTTKIIKEVMKVDDRIKYIKQENQGVGTARNVGIQNASGKYVTFLDADDEYLETFLEKMLFKIKNSKKIACYCGYYLVRPNREIKIRTKFTEEYVLKKYILGEIKTNTDSWIIDRNYLISNDLYFHSCINWGEDLYFFCRLLNSTKSIGFVPEYLTKYNKGFSNNRLSTNNKKKLEKEILLIDQLKEGLQLKEDDLLFKILYNYRLPSAILINLISLSNALSKQEMIDLVSRYKVYYLSKKGFYGMPTIKQRIRMIQLYIILRFKK